VLEGFHPLKHALRFGAEIVEGICVDRGEIRDLCARLAPDVGGGSSRPSRRFRATS
jgi:TrmH family RNA methyltransferase